jgi:MoaA/NifB/PqqE/SkfB family radical SAM enzyme
MFWGISPTQAEIPRRKQALMVGLRDITHGMVHKLLIPLGYRRGPRIAPPSFDMDRHGQIVKSPPRLVLWRITTGCNLRCIHCRSADAELTSPEDLSSAECFAVIDQIAQFAPLDLLLGGGEPLWRRDVFKLASYASERKIRVSLTTNGTLVDEAMAQRIHEAGIRRVAVSLDGANPTTHDTFRGHNGAFKASVRGLELLKDLGVSTQINTTVSRHNVHELPEILELADRLKVQAFHMFLLTPVGCGLTIPDDYAIQGAEAQSILDWIQEYARECSMEVKATCVQQLDRTPDQKRSAGSTEADEPPSPTAGSGICFISHQGEVFPYGKLSASCGSLREMSLKEIWDKASANNDLRETKYPEGGCVLCERKDLCMGAHFSACGLMGDYLAETPHRESEPRIPNAEHNTS